jgi:hypothetical protein
LFVVLPRRSAHEREERKSREKRFRGGNEKVGGQTREI